jgi:hypothetical protein
MVYLIKSFRYVERTYTCSTATFNKIIYYLTSCINSIAATSTCFEPKLTLISLKVQHENLASKQYSKIFEMTLLIAMSRQSKQFIALDK